MFTTLRADLSCPHEKHGDTRDLCSQPWYVFTPSLHTILIAAKGSAIAAIAKGSGIAQLIYQKHEKGQKAVSLTFPGGGGSREKRAIDVSYWQNR